MKIGELARKAGCPVETVRYYEKAGLLPAPLRDTVNNYRHYDQTHLDKLLFIRRCRALDMTHDEIRALLQAMHCAGKNCGPIDAIVREHLTHVRRRIAELRTLEAQLQALNAVCTADRRVEECGIIRELTTRTAETDHPLNTPATHPGGVH